MDLSGNNVFLYWIGRDYRLIILLRELIYLHASSGKGYTVHLITRHNVESYIEDLPACFDELCPAHQADVVRVYAVCKYGGVWLDSDVIVLESLDGLFQMLQEKNGFFMTNGQTLMNGVFGSKSNTELMYKWKNTIKDILARKGGNMLRWKEIGGDILTNILQIHPTLYAGYTVLMDNETMMPIYHKTCIQDLFEISYEDHAQFDRSFQPLLVLFNVVYKHAEADTEFRSRRNILNYFIDKSIAALGERGLTCRL